MTILKYTPPCKPAGRLLLAAAVLFFFTPTAMAATYWVSAVDGDDGADGLSMQTPFATVRKCADTAAAGDVCLIREGTYREMIRPAASGEPGAPIVFRAYDDETATVSGADVVTPGENGFGAWEIHSGNIYRITLPDGWIPPYALDQPFSAQVFVSGSMMTEARWPNFPDPTLPRRSDYAMAASGEFLGGPVDGFADGAYTHPGLAGRPDDFFKGARMSFAPGFEWWGTYGAATGSSGDRVTFSYAKRNATQDLPEAGDPFMIWGKLDFLDAPGECFLDEAGGTLYVRPPGDADPNALLFEVKRREKVVDLWERSHIRFEGLRFFGGRVAAGDGTTGITLHRVRSEYGYHHMYRSWGPAAVDLRGTGHVLSDSEILKTGSSGISIRGADHRVVNNVVHRTGYMPFLSDGIQVGGAANSVIENNSVFDTSALGISAATLKGGRVARNHIYNVALQTTDIAAINSWNGGDGMGTEIAWNMVHDVMGYRDDTHHYGGMGIRLDSGGAPDGNSNYVIHHNLVFRTTSSSLAIWGVPETAPNYGDSGNIVVNNTMDKWLSVQHRTGTSMAGTVIANNISGDELFYHSPSGEPDADVVFNNLFFGSDITGNFTGDPGFVSPVNYNFTLDDDSSAIDAGRTFPPLTDGYLGAAPDLGALEKGLPPFSAGAIVFEEDLPGLTVACESPPAPGAFSCRVTGFPAGRHPGPFFSLRIGTDGPATVCNAGMDLSTHDIFAACNAEPSGLTGQQPVYISGNGVDFLDSGVVVDLDPPGAAGLPAEPVLGPSPGAVVVITGKKFHTQNGHRIPIAMDGLSTTDLVETPVLVRVDTRELVASGRMAPDCSDASFVDDEGVPVFDAWVESGCGAENTLLWVRKKAGTGDEGVFSFEDKSAVYLAFGDPSVPGPVGPETVFPDIPPATFHVSGDRLDLSDGDAVAVWPDRSGNGRDAAQSDPARRPVFRTGGVNGLPEVAFDGLDDFFHLGDLGSIGYGAVFAVYRHPDPGPVKWQRIYSAAPADLGNDYEVDGAYLIPGNVDGVIQPKPTGALHVNRYETVDWSHKGDFRNFHIARKNNADVFYRGRVAELAVFTEELSRDARLSMEARLNRKYGFEVEGPTTTAAYADMTSPLSVSVGGMACENVAVISPERITCALPSVPPGAYSVAVTFPDGETIALAGDLVYAGPMPGDVACDGLIDLADAVAALKTTAGLDHDPTPCTAAGADVDGDERVGLAEAINALRKVAADMDG